MNPRVPMAVRLGIALLVWVTRPVLRPLNDWLLGKPEPIRYRSTTSPRPPRHPMSVHSAESLHELRRRYETEMAGSSGIEPDPPE